MDIIPAEQEKNREFTPAQKANWFPPGVSGNPAGRPKGSGLTDRLLAMLDESDEKSGKSKRELLALAWARAIRKGSIGHLNAFLDRVDGPVVQKQQVEASVTVARLVME